jgi:DNA-binding winged helix-turn-helix (wHTH) protein/tetratricopeptide (TPR) repeat protein
MTPAIGNRGPEAFPTLGFGEFRVDLERRTLYRDKSRIRIQRKPLEVLIFLAERSPSLVTRAELLQRFWSTSVNEESLTRCISTIRKHLDDTGDPPRYIETHRGVGYRFRPVVSRPDRRSAGGHRDGSRKLPSNPGAPEPSGTVPVAAATATRRRSAILLVATLAVAALIYWLSSRSPQPDRITTLAVLPITTSDESADWLASALTDELRRAVSRIEGVRVVTTAPEPRKVDTSQPVELGRALGVEALLAARLEAEPGEFRLRADLISTADGGILHTFSIDPDGSAAQSGRVMRLARAVAARIRPTLQLQGPGPEVDAETYRHYLRGRFYLSQRTAESLEAALRSFDAALDSSPGYADALASAAEAALLLPLYGAVPPKRAIPRARTLATRALASDPQASGAHAVMGMIALQYDWDWVAAEAALSRAVALDPNNAVARQWLGELYCYQARFEACRRELANAFERDPLSPVLTMLQGSPDLWRGDFDAAQSAYAEASEAFPDFSMVELALGLAQSGAGRWNAAIETYERNLPKLGLAIVGGPLIFALARQGDRERALALLADLEALAESRYVPPTKLATAHAGLGSRTETLRWLEVACETRDDRLVYLTVDSHFRHLRADPGFRAIVSRVGLSGSLSRIAGP